MTLSRSASRLHNFFLLLLTGHFTSSILCLDLAKGEEVSLVVLVGGFFSTRLLFD